MQKFIARIAFSGGLPRVKKTTGVSASRDDDGRWRLVLSAVRRLWMTDWRGSWWTGKRD